jgi:transposase
MEKINSEKLAIRKKIISLYKKKKTTREIAYLLDIGKSTSAFWIKRYKETGNLDDKPKSGTPPKLENSKFNKLKKVLLDFPPPRFGGESMGWTTKMAIQYVFDTYGVKYSMRRMQELFHKFGLNLITPRTEHIKSSYAAKTVYRMDFKKNFKGNIWIAPSLISTKQHLD